MAKDLYVQSKFNSNIWIRRDDINGDEDTIYNCQLRDSTTLPTDQGRFALGCELLVVDSGEEYNNIGTGLIPIWEQVGASYTFTNGLYDDAGTVKLGGTLIEDTEIDTDEYVFAFGGLVDGVGTVQTGIKDFLGIGNKIYANGFYLDTVGADDFVTLEAVGNLTNLGITEFTRATILQAPTLGRFIFQGFLHDDGNGNNSPGYGVQVFNDANNIASFYNQNSGEQSFGYFNASGTDTYTSSYTSTVDSNLSTFRTQTAGGDDITTRSDLREDYGEWYTFFDLGDAGTDTTRAGTYANHGYGINPYVQLYAAKRVGGSLRTSKREITLDKEVLELNGNLQQTVDANGTKMNNRFQMSLGDNIVVNSATIDLSTGVDGGNTYGLSVGTVDTIDGISIDGWQDGAEITLILNKVSVNHLSTVSSPYAPIALIGDKNLDYGTSAKPATIKLVLNGGKWYQTSLLEDATTAYVYSDATQSITAANTPQDITFNQVGLNKHFEILPGNAEFEIQSTGVYKFDILPQVENVGAGNQDFYVWASVDTGSGYAPIPYSGSLVEVAGSTNASKGVITLIGAGEFNKGDKIKFEMGASSTDVQLSTFASPFAGAPAIPSVRLTATKIK